MSSKPIERFSKTLDLRKLNRDVQWRKNAALRRESDARRFARQTEIVGCPVCSATTHDMLSNIHGFSYVTCRECTHVYVTNPPLEQALEDFYRNQTSEVNMRPSEDLLQRDLYLTRVEDIATPKVQYITESLGKKSKWVDIGCGIGEILLIAQRMGWQATGIEIDPQEIAIARGFGLTIVEAIIDSANCNELLSDADVISLFSVLEHVRHPRKLLEVIAKAAKPDAALVLELPHHPSISAFSNMAFPGMIARHMLPPNHLMLFTDRSLVALLTSVGFEPSCIWYFGQDFYELIGTILANTQIGDAAMVHQVMDSIPSVQEALDRAKLCDEFLIIAKRKQ
ncbi:MAG: class I SAM-dependent methyltransferase [Candidatus Levybacteria bacterium]|nr:class I SAM-dependent methyltransferase [Candidatus Levybacteria bacterium]